MISRFPSFSKVDLIHKPIIEELTKKFPPYSDHNFTSLLMWDVNGDTEVSILNQNLVIKFKDYESENKFYSFIGNNSTEETVEILISKSKKDGYGDKILLIPKDNFTEQQLSNLSKKYNLIEDRNNFDYILNLEELATLKGSLYLNKRNKINKFLKTYNPEIVIKKIDNQKFQVELIDAFNNWIDSTRKNRGEAFINYDEIRAFRKLIEYSKYLNVWGIAAYIEGRIRGFSLFEILDQEYAQHPVQKGDFSYRGIYEFLYKNMAQYLKENGIKFLNIYQDLGHEGLRKAKLDYNPTFLKKLSISEKLTD